MDDGLRTQYQITLATVRDRLVALSLDLLFGIRCYLVFAYSRIPNTNFFGIRLSKWYSQVRTIWYSHANIRANTSKSGIRSHLRIAGLL